MIVCMSPLLCEDGARSVVMEATRLGKSVKGRHACWETSGICTRETTKRCHISRNAKWFIDFFELAV